VVRYTFGDHFRRVKIFLVACEIIHLDKRAEDDTLVVAPDDSRSVGLAVRRINTIHDEVVATRAQKSGVIEPICLVACKILIELVIVVDSDRKRSSNGEEELIRNGVDGIPFVSLAPRSAATCSICGRVDVVKNRLCFVEVRFVLGQVIRLDPCKRPPPSISDGRVSGIFKRSRGGDTARLGSSDSPFVIIEVVEEGAALNIILRCYLGVRRVGECGREHIFRDLFVRAFDGCQVAYSGERVGRGPPMGT